MAKLQVAKIKYIVRENGTIIPKLSVQWRPGIGPPHKTDHSGIRSTFSQSQMFPNSHNVLSDSESRPIRDTDHSFSVPNHKRTKNRPPPRAKVYFKTKLYNYAIKYIENKII